MTAELLWRHLKSVPAFRALLRAVEARFYRQIELSEPVLDLGCGDGHFAQMVFDRPLTAGIDPWRGPLRKAQRSGAYCLVAQSMGDRLPFPDSTFASAVSNSVLEHIPDVQPVLNELSRVLRPEGRLVITMPSHYFTRNLAGARFFEALGSQTLADRYRALFNRIARHAHTDSAAVWAERLAEAGLAVERWQYYFSAEALKALEIGHVQGVPSAILHALTGHWIVAPWEGSLRYTERWLRPFYEEEAPGDGAYLFIIARKRASHAIPATLPPARPFTASEFEWGAPVELQPIGEPEAAGEYDELQALPIAPSQEVRVEPEPQPRVSRAMFALFAFASAFVGQTLVSRQPAEPVSGLRWFGLALLLTLPALWPERFRLPRKSSFDRSRWLLVPALLLSLIAYRLVAQPQASTHPGVALAIWLVAIAGGLYALRPLPPALPSSPFDLSKRLLRPIGVAALFFLAALVVRLYEVGLHPFMLTGSEASIGLEALAVTRGQLRQPFATGWLTNPTLPAFLLALPVSLLGPTTLALRLPSAFIGAATVSAVYLFGHILWRPAIGLTAATLLVGSHFHVHYSRLGMTNAWDSLLVLLALGLTLLAWRHPGRSSWLLAGLAIGANAYVYTGAHLLPLMLLALATYGLLFHRQRARMQISHIAAAALIALVVALPQLLYYNAGWDTFMERANTLAITRNGQLAATVATTGESPFAVLAAQFERAALAFSGALDNDSHYNPGRPLLSFWPALFFVLGFGLTVVRSGELRSAALLTWLVVTIIFAGALLENPPVSHRLVVATPALALMAAIGIVWLLEQLLPMLGGVFQESEPGRRQVVIVALILALLLTLADLGFYFGRYRAEAARFGDRNTEIAHRVADYLQSLDAEREAYFYGPPIMYVSFPTIPFLAARFQQNVNLFDVPPSGDLPQQPSGPFTAIFLPERAGELAALRERFPTGEVRSFDGIFADPLFVVYEAE